mmetsp:Transcript_24498/g.74747  ORF Transcript_24498/g.74747 Transcript_24498/m.74747 type:complete len:215 (+) Transcript_24498:531-1175(+)
MQPRLRPTQLRSPPIQCQLSWGTVQPVRRFAETSRAQASGHLNPTTTPPRPPSRAYSRRSRGGPSALASAAIAGPISPWACCPTPEGLQAVGEHHLRVVKECPSGERAPSRRGSRSTWHRRLGCTDCRWCILARRRWRRRPRVATPRRSGPPRGGASRAQRPPAVPRGRAFRPTQRRANDLVRPTAGAATTQRPKLHRQPARGEAAAVRREAAH